MNFLRTFFEFFLQSVQSYEEQAPQYECIFPIPKPHEIDPIYFTYSHKSKYKDHLFEWLFCEISKMQNGWLRMETEDPVVFNQMLYELAKKDVEISIFLCSLNGSGFNYMMAELRNLTITGFPTKYLLSK